MENITLMYVIFIIIIIFVVFLKTASFNKILDFFSFKFLSQQNTGEQQLMNVLNFSVYLKLSNAKVSGPSVSVNYVDENIENIKLFSELFGHNLKADNFDQLIHQIIVTAFNCATNKNIKFDELWTKYYSKGIEI